MAEDNSQGIIIGVVAALVIICLVFLLVRVLIFRRRARPRPREEAAQPVDNDYLMHAYLQTQSPVVVRMRRLANSDGLSAQELNNAAPVKPYAKATDDAGDSEENVCAVCLEEMEPDSKTRRMPCGHEFDARCIEEWVSKANRCPVCNTHIVEEEALQKRRIAIIEGRDPSPSNTRQRRRRMRGENGIFELREARTLNETERLNAPPEEESGGAEEEIAEAGASELRPNGSLMPSTSHAATGRAPAHTMVSVEL